MLDLEVRRDDLHAVRVVEAPVPDVAAGQALLRVERFGCTANNITYAVIGDMVGYWSFFPTEAPWGRIPVWGFAKVVTSANDALAEGTRVFGYCPMSTHMLVTPHRADEDGFVDATSHRSALPAAYNAYRRTDTDPSYDPGREDQQILLRPLFFLSFLLDDFVAANDLFGARTILLSSASSKTALGTAFLLAQRGAAVTALTSPANAEFVAGLGIYDSVVTYDALEALPEGPAVFLDIAGNDALRRALHHHYGDRLRHSALVGATHWDRREAGGDAHDLPGPKPAFFFAPEHLRARAREWGRAGVDARIGDAWLPFVEWCDGWLRIERSAGPDAAAKVYKQVLEGDVAPTTGHVLSLHA